MRKVSREKTKNEDAPYPSQKKLINLTNVSNDSGDKHKARRNERQGLVDRTPGTSRAGPSAGTLAGE
jgi:hypothetical protein